MMSQPLTMHTHIDSLKFAREQAQLSEQIAVTMLPRLIPELSSTTEKLDFALSGGVDKKGHAYLKLELSGEIKLTCQRCLGELSFPVQIVQQILIAPNEKALEYLDEEEELECLLANKNLLVIELIEDELLLSLPYAPKHDALAECEQYGFDATCLVPTETETEAKPETFSEKTQPFATALAHLKKN